MNAQPSALVLLAWSLLLTCSCGGKLEDPERFADLLAKRDGGGAVSGSKDGGPGGSGGSKGTGGSGGSSAAALPACVTTLIKNTCGAAGCHAAGSATIDLASAGVAARLVDKDSATKVCMGIPYIATDGTPSLLLDKVTEAMPPCGARMPIGRTLTAAEQKCLTDWVTSLGGTAGGT